MIPIIDIFAGPGGLGEGFSKLRFKGKSVFEIKLSIEKEENAHKTLTWRSFYRQFAKNDRRLPSGYNEAYRSQSIKHRHGIIENLLESTQEGLRARMEARLVELGSEEWPPERVDKLIKTALGEKPEEWILIGGPPCQAYSNAGRSRVGGIDPLDHRVYLYQEYLRIVDKHRPVAFVMENVQGLLSARVNGESVFERILEDLSLDGAYTLHSFVREAQRPSDYLISAHEFGIPQTRKRVILLGLAKGMRHNGEFLKKGKSVSVADALQGLPKIRSAVGRLESLGERISVRDSLDTWLTCMADSRSHLPDSMQKESKVLLELRDFESTGAEFVQGKWKARGQSKALKDWYGGNNQLSGVANFESRTHLDKDLARYLYASLYTKQKGRSPLLEDMLEEVPSLIPNHKSVSRNIFKDRFKCQKWDAPASTITSHISKDGHYFIHPDPAQCRSLVVREAARIQTFPDDYLFLGARTAQFRQVGNAVPPLLAYQLAEVVASILDSNGI